MVAVLGFSKKQITTAVQAMYAAVAAQPASPFHFPVGRSACLAVGYPEGQLESLPPEGVASFAGVGYPFRAGVIGRGDWVLDLGSGSGTDSLVASDLVGEGGRVWALDLTPAMLARLRATLTAAGIGNVTVIGGDAERIPLPDGSVDVVTSNGALNLVPDKRQAFAEIFRVLRPGGRVQIADIVIGRAVPLGGRSDPRLWAECVVGASVDEDYLALWRDSGFREIEVLRELDYFAASPSAETRRIASSLGARALELTMRRPAVPDKPRLGQRIARRMHPRRWKAIGERGLWGAVAAGAAVAACYGTLVLLALVSALGVAVTLAPGVWAATVAAAALFAVLATGLNLRRHRRLGPLLLSGLGAGGIAYAMFGDYDPILEALGFTALLAAVGLDLFLIYRAELC